MKRLSLFLASAAIVAIGFGLFAPASRWYQQRAHARDAQRQRDALGVETEAVRADLAQNKNDVLARMRALQSAGEHAQVMDLAARYRLADDKDVQSIYVRSAAAVSAQQTRQRIHDLAGSLCTSQEAASIAWQALAKGFGANSAPDASAWTLERLNSADYLTRVRERIRSFSTELQHDPEQAHAHAHDGGESFLDSLRGVHPPRLHPVVVQEVFDEPAELATVCVWRVIGKTPATVGVAQAGSFQMVLWLAPSLTERTMEYDVLSFNQI